MRLKRIFSWIAVILWMSLIFFLSHQPGGESSELSEGITRGFINTIKVVIPVLEINEHILHGFIRKAAHFAAYFVLGFLVINALRRSGIHGFRGWGFALIICVVYAITDEIHQLFIPGRSGEVRDVLIDTAGASIGIAVYWFISSIYKRRSIF